MNTKYKRQPRTFLKKLSFQLWNDFYIALLFCFVYFQEEIQEHCLVTWMVFPGFYSAKYNFPRKMVFHPILNKDQLMFFFPLWQPNMTSKCKLQQKKNDHCLFVRWPVAFQFFLPAQAWYWDVLKVLVMKESAKTPSKSIKLFEKYLWWTLSYKGHPRADVTFRHSGF